LVENTPEFSALELKPGCYVKLTVADTGTGIPREILDCIYEPYFTTKAHGEGTGMGLAMVYGIVENYCGKISVQSELNSGTVFTIYLPVAGESLADQPYEHKELPKGTENILFVDDETSIAKMGKQILERLGYSVTTRTDSLKALDLFRSRPAFFDLVITDLTMPTMTGDQLATKLMAIRQDLPVILCTGYSKKLSIENASEIGIRAFAYKPITKTDLAKTVRKVLDESQRI
jgi:CheY-like chemotaxis protein